MPQLQVNGADLHYEEHGSGPETIVFAHGYLFSGHMFDAQVAALKDRYRCVTFDFRGQGESAIASGGYDMDTLYEDAASLIRALGCAPCHFAGLSMGGFVGMRLAARQPELIRSLILLETSADPEPAENAARYRTMAIAARILGVRPLAPRVMPILFGRTFMGDPARAKERNDWQQRLAANRKTGALRALTGVTDRASIYDEIARITAPTLVIVGDEDVATVPAKAVRIAERIPAARLVTIPNAGHSSPIEEPEAVTKAIAEFLDSLNN
jgi:pimeloyl-ACP methyl ester carboxylesterase